MALQTIGIRTSIWNKSLGIVILIGFIPICFYACVMWFAHQDLSSPISFLIACIVIYSLAFGMLYKLQDFVIRETVHSLPVAPDEYEELFRFISYCCAVLKMDRPRVEILKNKFAVNAMSYGVDQVSYALVISEGMLNQPKKVWQSAVANELTQIYSGATRFLSMAHCYLYGTLPIFLTFMLVFGEIFEAGFFLNIENTVAVFLYSGLILLPIIYVFVLLIQRRLEYITDANTVILTKDAEALFQAIDLACKPYNSSDIPVFLHSLCFANDSFFSFHPSKKSRKRHLQKIYNVLDFSYADIEKDKHTQ